MKGFIRKEGSGDAWRRWLIVALVIVIGSGIVAVQGRGGGEHEHSPSIDLVDASETADQHIDSANTRNEQDEPDEQELLDRSDTEQPDGADRSESDRSGDDDVSGPGNRDVELNNGSNQTEHAADTVSPLQDVLTWPGAVGKWALVDETFDTLAIPDVGYAAWELASGEQRQAIHVLAWMRDSESVELHSALARGHVLGLEPVVAVADRLARSLNSRGSAIAAVNADFFMGSPVLGQPIGIHVSDGELIVDPNGRPLFALFDDGQAWIGDVDFQANVERIVGGESVADFPLAAINRAAIPNGLTLYTPPYDRTTVSLPHVDSTAVVLQALLGPLKAGATHQAVVIRHVNGPGEVEIPAQGAVLVGRGTAAEFVRSLRPADRILLRLDFEPALAGVQQAVAGSHVLVWNGMVASFDRDDPLVSARHPRTAIGYNDEAVFFVTVDGRQPGYASGMTLPELAELFVALGAEAALNLDGGGSTTMAIRRSVDQPLTVINRPSDGSPRAVGNALVLMSVEALPDPHPAFLPDPLAHTVMSPEMHSGAYFEQYLEASWVPEAPEAIAERFATGGRLGNAEGVVAQLWGSLGRGRDVYWEADAIRATAELEFHEAPAPLPLPDAGDIPILRLTYDLTAGPPGTAAAYAQAVGGISFPAEPRPMAIGLWVYGDGSEHWLRGHYIDAAGQQHVLNFTRVGGLNWNGWRYVTAPIDPGAMLPLELHRIYVVETDPARRSAGVLYFGPIEVLH